MRNTIKTFVIILFFVSTNLFSEERLMGTFSIELRNYDDNYTGDWAPTDASRDSLKETIWIFSTDVPKERRMCYSTTTGTTLVDYWQFLYECLEGFRPELSNNEIKAYLPRYEYDSFKTYINTQLSIRVKYTESYGKFDHFAIEMAKSTGLGTNDPNFTMRPKIHTKSENLTEFLLTDENGRSYQCFKISFTYYKEL